VKAIKISYRVLKLLISKDERISTCIYSKVKWRWKESFTQIVWFSSNIPDLYLVGTLFKFSLGNVHPEIFHEFLRYVIGKYLKMTKAPSSITFPVYCK
jgi:hypothetical protein